MKDSYAPFEIIGAERSDEILLICDHATNTVPPEVAGGDLGLPQSDMERHIAFDIGVAEITRQLAALLNVPAILSNFSRLVIDPNRDEDDPTLLMKIYDGTIIPANRHADAAEVERRLNACYRPYHEALSTLVAQNSAATIISIHSFTPQLSGRPNRPWHIGVLYSDDTRLARPLLDRLHRETGICVGDNEPYSGHLPGDTMDRHAIHEGRPHVLIEIRNDLIADLAGQTEWATRLAPILKDVVTHTKFSKLETLMSVDTQVELEAAAFRRLRDHLAHRSDVQNIDMMNLSGFCRNCLSRWYQEAANERGLEMTKEEAREIFLGMPSEEWKAKYQTEATDAQKAAFEISHKHVT